MARTVTDASGRYALVVQPRVWWIGAQKVGYQEVAIRVFVRSDRVVDVDLMRQ